MPIRILTQSSHMKVSYSEATDEEVVSTMLLQAAPLIGHRAKFPALLDGDRFSLG